LKIVVDTYDKAEKHIWKTKYPCGS